MDIYIPNKEEINSLIESSIEKYLLKHLPEAIRRGTRNKWLTTAEVADILKCSRRHIQYLRDSGQLSYSKINKLIRFDIDDVEEYLNQNRIMSLNSKNQAPF